MAPTQVVGLDRTREQSAAAFAMPGVIVAKGTGSLFELPNRKHKMLPEVQYKPINP